MASDDGVFYYDKLVLYSKSGAISAMVFKAERLVLYKEQCKQMVKDFQQVRRILRGRADMRTNHQFTAILKELYRQTFASNGVLDSCCCSVHVPRDGRTVAYSWLQVALTQNDESIFKVIRDDLKWCLELLPKVGNPSIELADTDRKELFELDKRDLRLKLENFLGDGLLAGEVQGLDRSQNMKLARFLLARLNDTNEKEHVFFANDCISDKVWSERQTINDLWHSTNATVTAIDWFGVRLARKAFRNQPADGACLVERRIMAQLNHPNVVRFISCSDQRGDPAILMEYAETSLQKHLEQRAKEHAGRRSGWFGRVSYSGDVNILEVVHIMYQTALGMAHLHENGVAHCDIKPSNLLINYCTAPGFERYIHLKIVDFGVSKSELYDDCLRDSSQESRGTTIYRAPELFGRARNVNLKKADLFSYAVTCWHILHGVEPFVNMTRATLQQELISGRRPNIDPEVPTTLANLIRRCWQTDPKDRPTFSEVCLDLQSYKEELLLGAVPLELISGPEITEDTTIRRWNESQRSYKVVKSLKTVMMRILSPPSFSKSGQDEIPEFPGDMSSESRTEWEEKQMMLHSVSGRRTKVSCCSFWQLFSDRFSRPNYPENQGLN